MQTQINLADIRSFVLIAQLGNFTKAAEALGVSRSHVSRQISQLEKQMGVTLLIRTTRTLKLTDAGKALFAQCEMALHSIDQAVLAAVDDIEAVRGEIRINCVGGYLGEEVIAEVVGQFMQQYPQVRVDLDFSSHRVDLIDVEMGTYASPSYLATHGRPEHPKELDKHACLTGSVTRWTFQHRQTKQTSDCQVRGKLRCKNGRVMLKGALAGNGIIRVPTLYCMPELEQGLLQEVFEDWHVPSVAFSALYHRDRYQPKRIRTFIEFTSDYFRQLQKSIKSA